MALQAEQLAQFLDRNPAIVRVTVLKALGSTPREAGTWMLVSADGLFGTIGGGQLELMAIKEARALLAAGESEATMDIPLGPDIGQCCGGRVTLVLDRLDKGAVQDLVDAMRRQDEALPQVLIFGAGHVGKALCAAFNLLPVRIILVETRQAELDGAPPGIEKHLTAMPESLVGEAAPHSAFVVTTHDHALDFLIVSQALARDDAAYVGMIGSKTKRATFASWHEKEGGKRSDSDRLICPIGGSTVRDKRPQVIAALVAAEIMTAFAV